MNKIFAGLAAASVIAAPLAAHAASRMQQSPSDDMKSGRVEAQTDAQSMQGDRAPRGATRTSQAEGVRTGTLECDVSAGTGFVIGSSRDVACSYKAKGAPAQRYIGSINRFGLDVGVTSKSVMVWQVVAPGKQARDESLAGKYRGVSGGASVGVGGGANVLVSSNSGFNLQPVSVGGERGLNLAAGVGTLSLRSADRG